jgi:CCR4-NOT transcription complex subunit 9
MWVLAGLLGAKQELSFINSNNFTTPLFLQVGLNYICATAERFFAVGAVLGNMVVAQASQPEAPSQRLLKHIIRCYLRLSDNPRAREALRSCLPELLRNAQFTSCLKNDDTTRRCVQRLHQVR